MRGILLLLPGDKGTIPRARELRAAGFTLSTAVALSGERPDRGQRLKGGGAGDTVPDKEQGPAMPVEQERTDGGRKAP